MTSDETIRKVADVIAGKTTELGSSTMRGLDRATLAARALAEAGLLAPAMREEWAIRHPLGLTDRRRDKAHAESGAGDGWHVARRWVSEWEACDG